ECVEHEITVQRRVILCPQQIRDVVIEFRGALEEIGEIRIFQFQFHAAGDVLRLGDMALGEAIADSTGAGMQNEPDRLRAVEADLDEMIPAPERAELAVGTGRRALVEFRTWTMLDRKSVV